MSTNYTLRKATADDATIIVHHRVGMFTDMGNDPAQVAKMEAPFRVWVDEEFAAGRFETWFACAENGEVIAGAGLWFYHWIPRPLLAQTIRPYILNVYTDPAYRRRGLARALMQTMIDWCRREGFARVTLHASDDGRHLYESLGFQASNEMRLSLR